MESYKKKTTPLWRNRKVVPVIFQILFVIIMGTLIWILVHNTIIGLNRMGIRFGFDFLNLRAGFNINESLIEYSTSDPYIRALIVGLLSTLRVSVFGIILATVLGVLVGIAKMSDNWLLSKVASVYIEIFRNTPLLLQIFIFNFAVFLSLPTIQEALSFGPFYLSNRGAVIPWYTTHATTWLWMILVVAYAIFSFIVFKWLMNIAVTEGKQMHPFLSSAGAFILLNLATFFIVGQGPVQLVTPETTGTAITGGLLLSTPFLSILLALTIFTSTYIAEIVRGGIQAVPNGQTEATQALGFKPSTAMRLVIFPQAVRIIIPPMTSQYLNLIKNSSLAMAVGFQEIVGVGNTVMNQSGRTLEVIIVIIGVYLFFNLTLSLFMNLFNKKFQLIER
ncbi:general L-amino acid transport system permease protein [Alkalibacterium subtropicum]|uniref:General L-amino acid transport system permease protein n=1 Tax=Alkalibacterium subtropicum TaxID=753702 RepID=A0A1I1JU41_9LACT|nr:ABC transporter permease subunit [Alkalibacterium subtropicum]SFC52036.1 general L-amino acid transport system permease protein [Alkalibacterium subtropicum]